MADETLAEATNVGALTIPDVPGYTYTITRGTPPGETGYPSNWHTLIVTDEGGIEVARLGFPGP
ncbi:hypothetical protein QSJ18_18135 [Gordonia sp. ABSL1-1]|uniref:hypothetical protein n=1 Tax=Gordonia sp. ABSL1-1 TaxID=3053923 RepID=UPI00257449D8|nr:hypothetical protein [Gordonia sp. ABSL1-1]MDL9938669.1 hypothetical protein [Gordonia sp. ABSL1-1]